MVRHIPSLVMPPKEIFESKTTPGKLIEVVDNAETRKYRTSPYGNRWHKMSSMGHVELAKAITRGSDFKVFHMIMPSLYDGNMVYVNQVQLGKELGIEPTHISRSLKRLVNAGIIERLDLTLSGKVYRLNPRIAWKGGNENSIHTKAIKSWDARNATIQ